MLTAQQLKAREFKITASLAPIVMAGDEAALLSKWRELIGEVEPPDLSDEWAPMLGVHLEGYILDWHEKHKGHALTERGRVVHHPRFDWCACTLDAFREFDSTTIDVKVCNSWQPLDDIVRYYTPQAIVQRVCRGAQYCSLLIMHGTAEPREIPVFVDETYANELWARINAFALCVQTLTPPVPLPKIYPPDQWRTVSLDKPGEQPNWGTAAIPHMQVWARSKEAADDNASAADEIKKLIPDDVGRVSYFDVQVRRDRRGYLSIRKVPA